MSKSREKRKRERKKGKEKGEKEREKQKGSQKTDKDFHQISRDLDKRKCKKTEAQTDTR